MKALLMFLIFIGCACTAPDVDKTSDELFELIKAHQSGDLKMFMNKFGQPMRIQQTDEKNELKYTYPHFETLVNPTKNEIITTSTFFWKSNDDYAYLKRMFGQHEWIEKPLPTSSHEISEVYSVEIPEIGVSFEYDRYAPKITWILISKPKIK